MGPPRNGVSVIPAPDHSGTVAELCHTIAHVSSPAVIASTRRMPARPQQRGRCGMNELWGKPGMLSTPADNPDRNAGLSRQIPGPLHYPACRHLTCTILHARPASSGCPPRTPRTPAHAGTYPPAHGPRAHAPAPTPARAHAGPPAPAYAPGHTRAPRQPAHAPARSACMCAHACRPAGRRAHMGHGVYARFGVGVAPSQ